MTRVINLIFLLLIYLGINYTASGQIPDSAKATKLPAIKKDSLDLQLPKSHLAFHAYYSFQMASTNSRDSIYTKSYLSPKVGFNAKLRLKDSVLRFLNFGFFWTQKGIYFQNKLANENHFYRINCIDIPLTFENQILSSRFYVQIGLVNSFSLNAFHFDSKLPSGEPIQIGNQPNKVKRYFPSANLGLYYSHYNFNFHCSFDWGVNKVFSNQNFWFKTKCLNLGVAMIIFSK